MKSQNTGGSLLPSSPARGFPPVKCPAGILSVRVIEQLDSHGLFLNNSSGDRCIAIHPNGYSCKSLADRIAKGDSAKICEQAQHITDCGGMTRSHEALVEYSTV